MSFNFGLSNAVYVMYTHICVALNDPTVFGLVPVLIKAKEPTINAKQIVRSYGQDSWT
jgi:hypothetical protein